MPKNSKDFPKRLDISVPAQMRLQLIAIAYMMGAGGEYATPSRNFLLDGIQTYVHKLEGRKLKDYEEILRNVMIQEGVPLDELDLNKKSPSR